MTLNGVIAVILRVKLVEARLKLSATKM